MTVVTAAQIEPKDIRPQQNTIDDHMTSKMHDALDEIRVSCWASATLHSASDRIDQLKNEK